MTCFTLKVILCFFSILLLCVSLCCAILTNVVHKACTMLGTLTKKIRVLNDHNSFFILLLFQLNILPSREPHRVQVAPR